MRKKKLCVIQARMGSTRLPGKVLKKVNGVPLLEYGIRRVRLSNKVNKIVVATTVNSEDNQIEKLCDRLAIPCFRGSSDDVLNRFFECSEKYRDFKNIVRVTGDCPLIDPFVIDEVLNLFEKSNYDYASNILLETFPDGMDVEVFKREALAEANFRARLNSEREHVTLYIRNNKKFKKGNLRAPEDFSHFRLTVDNREDFEVIKFLIENSGPADGYLKYVSILTKHPHIMLKNWHIVRNEGLIKSLKNDFKIKIQKP